MEIMLSPTGNGQSRGVDLIDIASPRMGNLISAHIFVLPNQWCFLGRGELTLLEGGYQNPLYLLPLLPCHGLNTDRYRINASDRGIICLYQFLIMHQFPF